MHSAVVFRTVVVSVVIAGMSGAIHGHSPPEVFTTVLPGPDPAPAFEPALTIDAANPKHIVVASMYGPFARGGEGIWVWATDNGGQTWSSERMPPPLIGGVSSASGADVIPGIARDGATLLTSMAASGAKVEGEGEGAVFVSRQAAGATQIAGVVELARNRYDAHSGRAVVYDKPWMIVDRTKASPHYGSVYVTFGGIPRQGRTGVLPGPKGWQLLFSVSKDDGKTFSAPRQIAESAFAGHLAIGANGALEIVYKRPVGMVAGGDALFHVHSVDGGATFETPVPVVTMPAGPLLEIPSIAARSNGDVMTCWSQGVRSEEHNNQVRCALKRKGGPWSKAGNPGIALPPSTVAAWPMITGTDKAWYLLLYLADSAHTEVALFRSKGAEDFKKIATLSQVAGLGLDRLCLSVTSPCRRTHTRSFLPGDYAALSSAGGRLAAAYVLPRPAAPIIGSAAVFVSLLDEPK